MARGGGGIEAAGEELSRGSGAVGAEHVERAIDEYV